MEVHRTCFWKQTHLIETIETEGVFIAAISRDYSLFKQSSLYLVKCWINWISNIVCQSKENPLWKKQQNKDLKYIYFWKVILSLKLWQFWKTSSNWIGRLQILFMIFSFAWKSMVRDVWYINRVANVLAHKLGLLSLRAITLACA